MEITVLHQTPKGAKLVTNTSKVVWLSPKQITEDNQLTPEGLAALEASELSYENYLLKEKESKEKFFNDIKNQREEPFNVKVLEQTQTDKAIAITAFVLITDESKTKLIWIPKSTIDSEGCVPLWMIQNNLKKLEKELSNLSEWKKVLDVEY